MKTITRVSFFVCFLCGALVNAKSTRILNGDKAYPGQFKYQISLQIYNSNFCGGAIIADQYVLTAAHCVVDEHGIVYSTKYHVIAGSTNVYSDEGVRIKVKTIYLLKKYKFEGKRNDIAVLKLRRGLGLGSNLNLQKINLPSSRESYVDRPAVISGYGLNYVDMRINPITRRQEEYNGHMDGKLRYVMTNIMSNEECDRKEELYRIDKNQICGVAVQREGQPTGICTGDSGSPLVRGNIVIGVASISPTGCREDISAAIYTRVSSFIGFIENAMKNVKTRDMRVLDMGESGCKERRKCRWPLNGCHVL